MKTLRWLGYGILLLLILVLTAAAVVYGWSGARMNAKYDVNVRHVHVPENTDAIARGKHIAETRGCFDCHGSDLGGAKIVENAAIGRWYGSNLTRGTSGLPASYSDVDYVRAIRHGLSTDGRPLFLMPSHEFSHFSDRDMGDLIAYLKSVPPVDRSTVPLTVGPLARVLILAGKIPIPAERIHHATVQPENITPGVTLEYGRYLAVGCQGCHGHNYAGGKIPGAPPDWPTASNLTARVEGSSANWTDVEFMAAMRTGRRPDGTEINRVMPWEAFGKMTDDELKALWMYLQSLPPTNSQQ